MSASTVDPSFEPAPDPDVDPNVSPLPVPAGSVTSENTAPGPLNSEIAAPDETSTVSTSVPLDTVPNAGGFAMTTHDPDAVAEPTLPESAQPDVLMPGEIVGDEVAPDADAAPDTNPLLTDESQGTDAIVGDAPAITNTQMDQAYALNQARAAGLDVQAITPPPASTNPDAPTVRRVAAPLDSDIPDYFRARADRDTVKAGDNVRVYQFPAVDPYAATAMADEDEDGFLTVDRGKSDGLRTVNVRVNRVEVVK